uniref:Transposase (Putative), gypsy type n=1 Tax=Tanacetum cinerariifolium TaxID=118510 RepID=A0A6L2LJL5_TANCI|nr:transposase (putative), gypsy type [Tanacetum cinerariifolium]
MEEMKKEWMARKMEANERMKDHVMELERQIDQGLRNHQAIIENLERQFEYLEKIQPKNAPAEMLRDLDQQMENKEDIADNTYYDLRGMYWWPCMRTDITTHVSDCLTCSEVKAEILKTFRLVGTLIPLDISKSLIRLARQYRLPHLELGFGLGRDPLLETIVSGSGRDTIRHYVPPSLGDVATVRTGSTLSRLTTIHTEIHLETAVNTISHEYLLEFTSEYGIPEMLHPELPGPGDRIVDFSEGKAGEEYPQCYTKPLDSLKNWNNRFFWVDECVFPTVVDWRTNASKDGMPASGTYSVEAFDSCLKSDKGEDWEPPRAPHEVPLRTLTAAWVIEMDEPATATDSSGVPSAIEKSPLDFAHEDGASDQGTTTPEVPLPEDVPVTAAPEAGQSEGAVAAEPLVARESRKRGHDGIDATTPPKSLRRDHAGLRPSGSSHGGKSLAAMQLCMASNIFVSKGAPADVSDPDPLSFADAPSHHPVNVAQSSQGVAAAGDPESENISSSAEVGSPGRVDALQQQVSREETLKAAFEEYKRQQDQLVEQRCAEIDARLDALSIDFDEELYPHMLTAIAGRRWVIGHGLRLVMMKCAESLEMRQAFADVVSAGIAKGMSEGLKHGVEHGHAQLTVESLEAYDPEAEAKFAVALQSLKDLKYPLLDQLEGLKDAPMDVIMSALYLESDTGGDAPQFIRDLRPSSSQLAIPSDGVPVSVPTVVPQGLALLLVDTATQTDLEDA